MWPQADTAYDFRGPPQQLDIHFMNTQPDKAVLLCWHPTKLLVARRQKYT